MCGSISNFMFKIVLVPSCYHIKLCHETNASSSLVGLHYNKHKDPTYPKGGRQKANILFPIHILIKMLYDIASLGFTFLTNNILQSHLEIIWQIFHSTFSNPGIKSIYV